MYGNILFVDSAGCNYPVHFGGDHSNSSQYRHHLHFYNNTFVAKLNTSYVSVFEPETTTNVEAWNNITYGYASGTPQSFQYFGNGSGIYCYDKQYGGTCGTISYASENWNSPIMGTPGVNGTATDPGFVNLAAGDVHISYNNPTIVGNGQPGDPNYPANSSTIPSEYVDFFSLGLRPYSTSKIDLGAFGF
jgi:hypothetical protein